MNQCDLLDRKKYTYLKIKRLQHVKDSEHKHEDIEIPSTILKAEQWQEPVFLMLGMRVKGEIGNESIPVSLGQAA